MTAAHEETPAERRARWRSIGVIKGGRTPEVRTKTITRPEAADPACGDNKIDAGRKAKVTVIEDDGPGRGAIIYTTSDNRQDANVIGVPAKAPGAGEIGEG